MAIDERHLRRHSVSAGGREDGDGVGSFARGRDGRIALRAPDRGLADNRCDRHGDTNRPGKRARPRAKKLTHLTLPFLLHDPAKAPNACTVVPLISTCVPTKLANLANDGLSYFLLVNKLRRCRPLVNKFLQHGRVQIDSLCVAIEIAN